MPPQTRALFLVHSRQARPGDTQQQILRDWTAKTKEERVAWADCYRYLSDASATVDELDHDTTIAVQAVDAIRHVAQMDVPALHEAMENARPLCKKQVPRLRQLRRAWTHLRDLELAQEGQNARSTAHANNEIAQIEANIQNFQQTIANYRHWKRHPPVPQDEDGNFKMKAHHFPGSRRELLDARAQNGVVDVDVVAHDPRLLVPGNDRWLAQREFSEGMANGWLWLQIDDNDCIVDVSVVLPPH